MIQKIDEELCIGCKNCDEACPMDVIYFNEETKKAEIKFREDCMTCYNCELYCPVNAIYVDPIKKESPRPW